MKVSFVIKNLPQAEPLGIMYLSAALKAQGYKTELVDLSQEHNPIQAVINSQPDVVAYSVTTGIHKFYQQFNEDLQKSKRIFSVFGGSHPTFFPEFLNESYIDSICIGEGEAAFVDLIRNFDGHKLNTLDIQNFHFKNDGNIKINKLRKLEENLDSLDFPDRELIRKYINKPFGNDLYMMATRGCPYQCSYCFNESYGEIYEHNGKRVRFRSVDNVIEEINLVTSKQDVNMVFFQDDVFIMRKSWLREFSEKYKQEVGLPFYAHARADLVDEEVVDLLKHAGCVSLDLGIEAGNEEVRNKILSRNLSNEQILYSSMLIKKAGIKLSTKNLLAVPGTTFQNDLETLKINMKIKPDYAWVSLAQPYPKTKLHSFCEEKGIDLIPFDEFPESFHEKSPMPEKGIKYEILHDLFPITSSKPYVYPITKLMSLTGNDSMRKISRQIYYFWRDFSYHTKMYSPSETKSPMKKFKIALDLVKKRRQKDLESRNKGA
jgi:anaerobic magnesium-protoporphyrin IX monomethyl ester cyclase